ncbi:MAG: hypothetical protein JSS43_08555 [Proteobacteria bacterium]|nr:hypothetical protein [Pseudomonadota bacterium]
MTKEQRMQNAWRTAQSLKHLAVPPAVQVTEFIGTGYTEGKFGFLEVLGAKRILFKGALREVHVSQAEFERLRGQEAGLSTTGSAR